VRQDIADAGRDELIASSESKPVTRRKEHEMDATLERTISTSRIICPEAEPAYGCREATVDHRQMPLVTALGHYQDTIEAPFSAPGHKRGAGASTELRSLLGDDALAADVWMGVGAHDPAQRAAEELAAELVLSCTVEDPVPAS
jgi:hypothetical protein